MFFCFKQKTAYEMRISDWSSDVCSSDLRVLIPVQPSPYDLWASVEMVALIREAQVFRPALRAAFVINRRVSTTVIGREARQALTEQPLPALRSEEIGRASCRESGGPYV